MSRVGINTWALHYCIVLLILQVMFIFTFIGRKAVEQQARGFVLLHVLYLLYFCLEVAAHMHHSRILHTGPFDTKGPDRACLRRIRAGLLAPNEE